MTYIGFDHHKKWTQAAAIDEKGKIIREMRVLNDSSSLKGFLKGLPKPLKGVVEAGPTWGWIYDILTELGVKIIVANPSAVRAIAAAKIKTDRCPNAGFFVAGGIDPRGLCSHRRSSISKDAVAGENLVGPDARSTQEPYPSVAQSLSH